MIHKDSRRRKQERKTDWITQIGEVEMIQKYNNTKVQIYSNKYGSQEVQWEKKGNSNFRKT